MCFSEAHGGHWEEGPCHTEPCGEEGRNIRAGGKLVLGLFRLLMGLMPWRDKSQAPCFPRMQLWNACFQRCWSVQVLRLRPSERYFHYWWSTGQTYLQTLRVTLKSPKPDCYCGTAQVFIQVAWMLYEESKSRPKHVVVQGFVTRGKWIRRIAILKNDLLHVLAPCSSQPDVTTKYTEYCWLFLGHLDFIHTSWRKHEELQMTEGIEINVILLLLGPVWFLLSPTG